MKITTENDNIIVEEVYAGFLMRTREGNEISICMRDDTFEINILPQGKHTNNWWRVDMKEGTIVNEFKAKPKVIDPEGSNE